MDKDQIVGQIKQELTGVSLDGAFYSVSFKLLDDGTLCVQTYNDEGHVDKTYAVNISIGRELEKAEWQEP